MTNKGGKAELRLYCIKTEL